mmetsp:Transcript_19345/g.27201  ORF Transcript_19345/g.27201 Transcript_19345/m.27201 type:complete len:210 (-) Transcript_19345:1196-1825(-)
MTNLATEFALISHGGTVGDHSNLPCDAETFEGWIGWIGMSIVPFGIGIDGLTLDFGDANLPGGVCGPAGDGHDGSNEGNGLTGVIVDGELGTHGSSLHGMLDGLHSAEGSTDDAFHGFDSQVVLQHVQLECDGIANAHIREMDAVGFGLWWLLWLFRMVIVYIIIIITTTVDGGGWTGATITASKDIATNHKIFVGIECLTRTQEIAPP